MGVLANHVPSIEQLKPGLIEVIEESGGSKQFFREYSSGTRYQRSSRKLTASTVSGGYAIVQPNSTMSINAVEGFPLEDFSAEAVKSQIAEAQKVANGSGSEQDIAEAKIELEVSSINYKFAVFQSVMLTVLLPTGSRESASRPEIDVYKLFDENTCRIPQNDLICL